MIRQMDCPICGGPIMLEYIRPDLYFYIENGKIERDDNNDMWEGKNPYLRFRCSNDSEHDIESKTIIDDPEDTSLFDWMQEVQNEFYDSICPEL